MKLPGYVNLWRYSFDAGTRFDAIIDRYVPADLTEIGRVCARWIGYPGTDG